jgi:hypothetical protein
MFKNVRLIIEIVIGVFLLVLFLWYRHSLITEGENIVKEKDKQIMAASIVHKQEVETKANEIASTQIEEYKKTVAAPPADDAPHFYQCLPNKPVRQASVREVTGGGSIDNAAKEQPTVVSQSSETTRDYGPDIDTRFRDDDALIKVLQDRVRLDIETCGK